MTKTTYKVTGPSFMRWKQGEEFEANLDEALEARAIARGQIKKTTPKTKKEEKADG